MAIIKRRKNRRTKGEINVVPYIDVMLVLLVIFMISAPLIQQSVKVDLPTAGPSIASDEQNSDLTLPLILTVDVQGRYYLNISPNSKQALNTEQVKQYVQQYLQSYPGIDVYVRGDANAKYQQVMQGLEFLHQSGAQTVNFSTEMPAENLE